MSATRFQRVLAEAIADFEAYGYDSQARVDWWVGRLRRAAEEALVPEAQLQEELRRTLGAIYQRAAERGSILYRHPGVDRFTLDRIKPELRQELSRRILASANLIRLNREQRINETLQRFAGWATAMPIGGTRAANRRETKENVRQALASLPFAERRVLIDQGHKLNSSISDLVAKGGNAIAGQWVSNWRQSGYQYRPEHKARDGLVYAIRGNWAIEAGLMKPGFAGYTDEITAPAYEPMCRCFYRYIYNIGSLPDDMVTVAGRKAIGQARKAIAA